MYHRGKKMEKIWWRNYIGWTEFKWESTFWRSVQCWYVLVSNVCIQNILGVKMSRSKYPMPLGSVFVPLPALLWYLATATMALSLTGARCWNTRRGLPSSPSLRSMPACLPVCSLIPASPPLVLFLFEFPGQDLENTTHGRCSVNICEVFVCFFGCAMWLAGSQFPNQGSNLCPAAMEV